MRTVEQSRAGSTSQLKHRGVWSGRIDMSTFLEELDGVLAGVYDDNVTPKDMCVKYIGCHNLGQAKPEEEFGTDLDTSSAIPCTPRMLSWWECREGFL